MQQPKFEQPKQQLDIVDNIQSLALKSELNDRQRNYLDKLVAQLNKILSGRTVKQMVAAQDLPGLENYLETVTQINRLLKKQEMSENTVEQQIADWENFYEEVLVGGKRDFNKIALPEKKEGFDRLIIMNHNFSYSQIIDLCREKFPVSVPEVVNAMNFSNERRRIAGTPAWYALWVRDRQEADEELKNLSAHQVNTEMKINGITLSERLIFELKYFHETGRHLDNSHTSTICSGSSLNDLSVPIVYFKEKFNKLVINSESANWAHLDVRVREVVL